MIKITLQIDGMACGMCESHVNTAIRNAFPIKKVSSSHIKGKTEILAEEMPDMQKLREAIASVGYTMLAYHSEPYIKKSLFARLAGK